MLYARSFGQKELRMYQNYTVGVTINLTIKFKAWVKRRTSHEPDLMTRLRSTQIIKELQFESNVELNSLEPNCYTKQLTKPVVVGQCFSKVKQIGTFGPLICVWFDSCEGRRLTQSRYILEELLMVGQA